MSLTEIKLLLVMVSLTLGSTLTTPIFELYRQQYRLTDQGLAMIFASYVAGVIISLLGSSVAVQRWGDRSVGIAAATLSTMATAVFLMADTALVVGIARVLSGISVGLGTATLTTMLRNCLPASTAAKYASAGISTGLASGPLLAEAAIRWLPDPARNAYWLYFPLPAVSLTLLLTIQPGMGHVRRTNWPVPKSSASGFRVLMSTATLCCAYALSGYYLSLGPSLLQRDMAMTHLLAALAVTILLISAVIGQAAARSLPQQKLERLGLAVLVGGGLCATASVLAVHGPAFILAIAILGIGHGMTTSSSLIALNYTAGSHRTTAYYYAWGYLASALPIVGTGWLSDQIGIRAASVVFFLIGSGGALVCYALLARTRHIEECPQ